MNNFYITFLAVLQMLAYASVAFALMRWRKFNQDSIKTMVTLLLYVCQPCLTFYSFQRVCALIQAGAVSKGNMLMQGLYVLLLSLVIQLVFLGLAYFVLRKKQEEPENRIFVIATVMSNSGFFGVPILEALMGEEHPEILMFSALFSLVMNALCWTVASAIITRDRTYVSPKKVVFNPNTVVGLLGVGMLCFGILLPSLLGDMVTMLGRFSTPLCMFILGMRLALVRPRDLLCNAKQYLICLVKNFGFPLFAFAVLYFIPIDGHIKQALFILCACPAANMVLSFAEMLGQGQKTAANVVLLSTIGSILTLPLLCLLLPFLA